MNGYTNEVFWSYRYMYIFLNILSDLFGYVINDNLLIEVPQSILTEWHLNCISVDINNNW